MLGSSVAVARDFLVTNCHVVQNSFLLRVRRGNEKWTANLIQANPGHDLCGLRPQNLLTTEQFGQRIKARYPEYNDIPNAALASRVLQKFPTFRDMVQGQVPAQVGPVLQPVVLRLSAKLATGERVYAVGAPEGLELTFSEGIISALRENDGVHVIQTSAPISPGSSGGGLFDAHGNLVGVTSFYLKEGQSLNFAVPGDWVAELLALPREPEDTKSSITNDLALESVAWRQIGSHAEEEKNYELAVGAFSKSVSLRQADAHLVCVALADAYFNLSKHSEEIEALREAIRLKPDYAEAWLHLSMAYHRSKKSLQAVSALKQAIDLDPKSVMAWRVLYAYSSEAGQRDRAIEALQRALEIEPQSNRASTLYLLGEEYVANGDRTKAIEIYEELKKIDTKQADALFRNYIRP
jgi:Tfp pilus assembly protein PilF